MPLPDPKRHTIMLSTFRRTGTAVNTPVWYIVSDGRIWVQSLKDTGKVKRLRHDARVRFAPSHPSGSHVVGDWSDGAARLSEDPETIAWLVGRQKRKYTWLYFLIANVIYPLRRRTGPVVVIEITPDA